MEKRSLAIGPLIVAGFLAIASNADCQNYLSVKQVAQYAYSSGFNAGGLVNAISIAWAESEFNADAWCDACVSGVAEGSRGLWQININAHPEYAPVDLFDPANNANAARTISAEGTDWAPWSTFGGSAWQNYLSTARIAASSIDSRVVTGNADAIEVTWPGGANVRSTPAGSLVGGESYGSTGTVVGGPIVAVYQGYTYTWWRIEWNDGSGTGWSVEDAIVRTGTVQPAVQITLSTSPSGLYVAVDNQSQAAATPATFNRTSGSSHTITAISPQTSRRRYDQRGTVLSNPVAVSGAGPDSCIFPASLCLPRRDDSEGRGRGGAKWEFLENR